MDFGDYSDTEETLDDELNHNCQDMINFFLNDQISKLNIADNWLNNPSFKKHYIILSIIS